VDAGAARPVAAEAPRTILMVDDEESILSSLKRLFRRDGYRILTANSGMQGLEILAGNTVDVIISDQRMPNMTGVEFLRQVKQLHPETVRIVLSGYTELNSITEAINEGAIYKFLTKPWDDEQLRLNVQEAFQHKALADENRRLAIELGNANRRLQQLLEEKQRQLQVEKITLDVLREILQLMPLPVLGFDNEGMIVSVNQEAEKLLGKHAPLIGTFADDVLPASLLATLRDNEDGVWHDKAGRWHTRYRRLGSEAGTRGRLIILSPDETVNRKEQAAAEKDEGNHDDAAGTA
jgi:response regulator RpfG family c-di-GMP phosphodiesterase